MDNLTHSLVGLAVAKAGLERASPLATTVCVVAANAADADLLSGLFGGRWTALHYHRGITHSITGTVVLGVLIPTIFYLFGRAVSIWRQQLSPMRYSGLLLASLIAAATHPALDWTNNYGVRFLLPWNARWFYGDMLFIVDPYIWLMLGGAVFLLTSNRRLKIVAWATLGSAITLLVLFAPVQRAMGSGDLRPLHLIWIAGILGFIVLRIIKINERAGKSIAIAALALVIIYSGVLAAAHKIAYQRATDAANELIRPSGEIVQRMAAMPTLGDPRRWLCVAETDRAIYRFVVRLGTTPYLVESPRPQSDSNHTPAIERFEKTPGNELVNTAVRDPRAQILLGFARFPFAKVEDDNCVGRTVVEFADLRYTEPGPQARGNFSLNVPVDCASR